MSSAAREQLDRYWPWSRTKISTVPHGIERRFAQIADARRERTTFGRYVLAVSTLGPHKNFDGLLRAFARFKKTNADVRLVVAGIKGSRTNALETLRHELGLDDDVTFTGWIPREDLYDLYENALAFVYPSRFEGFGIPVLEALAAGLPTACSAIPSLLEIADGCARFFDPDDVADIATAVDEIATTAPNRATIDAGRTRAASYGWETSARRLIDALAASATGARGTLAPHESAHPYAESARP